MSNTPTAKPFDIKETLALPSCPYFLRYRPADGNLRRISCDKKNYIILPVNQALNFKNQVCCKDYKQCPIWQMLEAYYYTDIFHEAQP